MKEKDKIELAMQTLSKIHKTEDFSYNLLSPSMHEKMAIPHGEIEDTIFVMLFGESYGWLHENFTTPGDKNKSKELPVLWDSGWFPPEKLIELLMEPTSKYEDVKYWYDKIKEGMKEHKKLNKNKTTKKSKKLSSALKTLMD